jgi:hypothetical protein
MNETETVMNQVETVMEHVIRNAKVLVAVGLVLVVFTRGCDSLGARAVKRADAQYRLARQRLDHRYDKRIEDAEGEELTDLREERTEALEDIEEDEGRHAQLASSKYDSKAYWYEWGFLLGSIVLVLGLLGVGYGGNGAERLVALIMLAIITFSIYVGGAAWMASIKLTM